jgi:hypothetical protein
VVLWEALVVVAPLVAVALLVVVVVAPLVAVVVALKIKYN